MSRLYLAPMEGLTYIEYRAAYHKCFADFDRYYTPFIAPGRYHLTTFSPREKRDVDKEANAGMDLAVQLLTKDAGAFASVARDMAAAGYTEVNLNLGCPSPTVTNKGRGAGMLRDVQALDAFFDEVFETLQGDPIRISVKSRIGYASAQELPKLMEVFNQYPISEIILHPRTGKQGYGGVPDRQAFQYAYENSRNPLAYNGDINTVEDYERLMASFPDVSGVMLGRGALKDPWLVEKIRAAERGEPYVNPSEEQKKARLRAFHAEVFACYEAAFDCKNGVVDRMKEFWTWLGASLPGHEKELKAIRKARRLPEYQAAVRVLLS